MLRKSVVLMLMILMTFTCIGVYAADQNAATKLGRGLVNGLTGIVEVPKQIYLVSKEREPITGITFGLAKGLCYGVLRTATGVYDTLSFPIPPYNKPVMEPEFVFESWE
ncbi:MAG: exosortase system-associated protein, TIGR04073 family [Candidatus Omnitrophica bacterium]|nr:exosortase system-associated protein, TIGR04073 family [Candidatus Omnitrophota bacterium]